MVKSLVIGASGQIGTELTQELRKKNGSDSVVAADLKKSEHYDIEGPFEQLDILEKGRLRQIIEKYKVDEVYHLVAVLSAKGEAKPLFAWELNMASLIELLEMAKEGLIKKIFWPSSIAVFGPNTPKSNTPQHTITDPNTVYGISKLAGERWCEYYHQKYHVDVRSLRFPGLIGYKTLPGGGTTDYAVDIFHSALNKEKYACFLRSDTQLPMMFMPDAIRSIVTLMNAKSEDVKVRSSYNLAAMSFTPKDIFESIRTHLPEFDISYSPDFRQKIADSWPNSINDEQAQKDWGWQHQYDLNKMTSEILQKLPEFFSFTN